MLQTSLVTTKTNDILLHFDNCSHPNRWEDMYIFVSLFYFLFISFEDLDVLMVSFKVIQLKRKTIVSWVSSKNKQFNRTNIDFCKLSLYMVLFFLEK